MAVGALPGNCKSPNHPVLELEVLLRSRSLPCSCSRGAVSGPRRKVNVNQHQLLHTLSPQPTFGFAGMQR